MPRQVRDRFVGFGLRTIVKLMEFFARGQLKSMLQLDSILAKHFLEAHTAFFISPHADYRVCIVFGDPVGITKDSAFFFSQV